MSPPEVQPQLSVALACATVGEPDPIKRIPTKNGILGSRQDPPNRQCQRVRRWGFTGETRHPGFIDTADMHLHPRPHFLDATLTAANDELVGKAMKARRSKVTSCRSMLGPGGAGSFHGICGTLENVWKA
ncbi:hypothetical protein BDK51DRAFT_34664, partial [Blyttiomyces helicus]